jgi:hypothetical protein
MEKDSKTTATWWTLDGFVLRPEPEAFNSMPDGDWNKVLAKAGYKLSAVCGGSMDDINIIVYDHSSGEHSFVEFASVESVSAHFFVRAELMSAFYVSWYLKAVRDAAIARQSREISRLADTFVAFVRHGHGRHTIDVHGYHSLDDEEAWREWVRQNREEKARRAPKSGGDGE